MHNPIPIRLTRLPWTPWLAMLLCAAAVLAFSLTMVAKTHACANSHTAYFEDTDHELHVYRVFGKRPGKTLMLIGGIQGNEPGGFHSADLYTETCLAKGNLIVVPRANLKSIILNRRSINADMNRKFAEDRRFTYETKIVAILKKLIAESDGMLNLHDGSGFYAPKWQGPDRNPMRYGQSIIADCEVYKDTQTGKVLNLGEMARRISQQVNKEIENKDHHFHFNNHRTRDESSQHKEQRKSATYYALYTCGIPAFGIEASKSLPLELKIRYHKLIINSFMDVFDIQPDTPGIKLEKPRLKYLIVSVNDKLPVVLENGQSLYITPGDSVKISHIEANYERGLTADLLGYGGISDARKRFRIDRPTQVVVRKDNFPCARVHIRFGQQPAATAVASAPAPDTTAGSDKDHFKIRVNGLDQEVADEKSISITRGDILELVDADFDGYDSTQLTVNFKGFVGNRSNNTGEDRGYRINTAKDLWKRYALDKSHSRYQIIASLGKRKIGRFFVVLKEPRE